MGVVCDAKRMTSVANSTFVPDMINEIEKTLIYGALQVTKSLSLRLK